MPTKRKSTRAAQGAGTIRQRPDGRWEARYTVGRDPGTGRQVQKSIYGSTQKEVLDKLTAIKAALNSGTYTEPSKLTVGQWLDICLADYLGNVKDATARSYRDNVALHIKPALGAVPLQKLNAHTIQSLYNNLLRNGRIMQKGQKKEAPTGLSARSVRIVHAVLHMALKQAVAIGYIKANPSEVCTLPRTEKKEMEILAAEEIASFLSAIEDHKHGALFLFILFSGVRRGEALGLT